MTFADNVIKGYEESLISFLSLFQVNKRQSSKVALLESFYIIYEKLGVRKTVTPEIYNAILNNSDYISYARQGTVKWKSMNERWKTVYEIWSGTD